MPLLLLCTHAALLGVGSEPRELERGGVSFAFPFDLHRAIAGDRRADAGAFGQIGDVDEPLTAVRVAVLGPVVEQPQARKLAHPAPDPLDRECLGCGTHASHLDSLRHVTPP